MVLNVSLFVNSNKYKGIFLFTKMLSFAIIAFLCNVNTIPLQTTFQSLKNHSSNIIFYQMITDSNLETKLKRFIQKIRMYVSTHPHPSQNSSSDCKNKWNGAWLITVLISFDVLIMKILCQYLSLMFNMSKV